MKTKTTTPEKTRAEKGTRELIKRKVRLDGITDIMFDRYPGDNDTQLTPAQKLYFARDGETLVLPANNVMSFLSAKNTDSAPKRLLDSRKYKKFTEACASFLFINPDDIPFIRESQPIIFGKFIDEYDAESGVFVKRDVARLEKGIPNPKVRPVLPMPWSLEFELSLFPNKHIQEQQVLNIFEDGGVAVGLGTWRGRYGKFEIGMWE